MESNIMSEIHQLRNEQCHVQQQEEDTLKLEISDADFEEALSILSANDYDRINDGSTVSPTYVPYFPLPSVQANPPQTFSSPPGFQPSVDSLHTNTPQPPLVFPIQVLPTTPPGPSKPIMLPQTPVERKIRTLVTKQCYQDPIKDGELAVQLAFLRKIKSFR